MECRKQAFPDGNTNPGVGKIASEFEKDLSSAAIAQGELHANA